MTALISKDTLETMIAVHKRADPYSPYGNQYSYEYEAEREKRPNAKRAIWLTAAAHWRGVMHMRLIVNERDLAFRAYKFARMAVSAARHVEDA